MFSSILTVIYICIVDMFVLVVRQRMTGRIVSLPEPFGELSVCYRALPTVPAVGQKEQRGAPRDGGVPEAAGVLSGLLCGICSWGERGIAVAGCTSAGDLVSSQWGLIVGFLHQLHQQQCPFASVTCQYCDLDLVRNQVSEWAKWMKWMLWNLIHKLQLVYFEKTDFSF